MKKAIVRSLLSGALLAAFVMPESAQAFRITVTNESSHAITVGGYERHCINWFYGQNIRGTRFPPHSMGYLFTGYWFCPSQILVAKLGSDFTFDMKSLLPFCFESSVTITNGNDGGIKVSPWPF